MLVKRGLGGRNGLPAEPDNGAKQKLVLAELACAHRLQWCSFGFTTVHERDDVGAGEPQGPKVAHHSHRPAGLSLATSWRTRRWICRIR